MEPTRTHEVLVYQDESKAVAGNLQRAHVLLFVPVRLAETTAADLFGPNRTERCCTKQLLTQIAAVRRDHALVDRKLHFTEISGRTWGLSDLGYRRVVETIVEALRGKGSTLFRPALCCKLAVMIYQRAPKSHLSKYGGVQPKEQERRHDETVLRMLLKGSMHYLYGEQDRVVIRGIIADGHGAHRDLSRWRVVDTLFFEELHGRTRLRSYVDIAEGAGILHVPSDHKLHRPGTPGLAHANLLQVGDLLLGSTIQACREGFQIYLAPPPKGAKFDQKGHKRDVVAYPVWEMLQKRRSRGAGFLNSGHYRAFTISRVVFEDAGPVFSEVDAPPGRWTPNLELKLDM